MQTGSPERENQEAYVMGDIDPIQAIVILVVISAVVLILLRTKIWLGL